MSEKVNMEMDNHPVFSRYPELKEFVKILRYEIQQAQRPASEVILDDEGVMRLLSISKRKLQYLKSKREIPYQLAGNSKRTYYFLQDILEWIKKGRVESVSDSIKIKSPNH